MALIPGSYARAAGLQSEINKVTITRVAGSELQFRRTIDTYQRDLRYHVNQIGREQKKLKRSMRKYSRKLRDSRKEQKLRLEKAKEDTDRLRRQAEAFRQAEAAVKLFHLPTVTPITEQSSGEGENETLKDSELNECQTKEVSESSNSQDNEATTGSEICDKMNLSDELLDDKDEKDIEKDDAKSEPRSHKVFLTKNKLPYLRPNRGHKDKKSHTESHKLDKASCDDPGLTQTTDMDLSLPIIDEESEDVLQQSQHKLCKPESLKTLDSGQEANPGNQLAKVTDSSTSSMAVETKTGEMTSLDTKAFSRTEDNQPAHGLEDQLGSIAFPALGGKGKRASRKTMVSYGDLIKLQHTATSNTKKLFQLVDCLASKHGIKDPPTPPSLDPRSNDKIKMRGHGPQSQMSGGMVKQAAVLYSMKYGYQNPHDPFHTNALPPIRISKDMSDDINEAGNSEVLPKDRADSRSYLTLQTPRGDVTHRDSEADVISRRMSSLSVRRGSTAMTSPFPFLSESMTATDDIMSPDVTQSLDRQHSRSGRSRQEQALTLWELSQQADSIREKSQRLAQSKSASHDRNDITPLPHQRTTTLDGEPSTFAPKLSPIGRRSRSLSRSRRDNVSSQLQKRLTLTDHEDGGNKTWQSAFGRLKLLHTLHDLSQHF